VPPTRDEVAALARTLNGLLQRLESALDRERQLVADTAHELRTPLAILRTELEIAQRQERTREELAAAVASAGQETARLTSLAEDLLFLARSDEGVPVLAVERQHIWPVLTKAVEAQRARAAGGGVALALEGDPWWIGEIDALRLRQAMDNLLDNALRVAPPGSTVAVHAAAARSGVVITVSDRGPGFPDHFLPHAFERFSRADAARSRSDGGAGLGLSVVGAVARAHGGRATVVNQEEGGATVSLILPAEARPNHESVQISST
jgi:two-component system OmpR family sensor kinase